jgi:pilus assembly protein CpaE
MTRSAIQNTTGELAATVPAREEHIAPAPRISIQAFCESVETAAAVQAAGEDRRLGKAHLKIQMGGMTAALEAYRSAPTPNVIILEFESAGGRPCRSRFSRGTLRPWNPRCRDRTA